MKTSIRLGLFGLLLALALPSPAATVIFARGQVGLEGSGATLERGMTIPDDALIVSADGFAQIRLANGTLLSVRPGDRRRLEMAPVAVAKGGAKPGVKNLLQRVSGRASRASRATLPEALESAGDQTDLGIVNSLNFSIPSGPAGGASPEGFAISLAGVTAGADGTAPVLSERQGTLLGDTLAAAGNQWGFDRDDGSELFTSGSPDQEFSDPDTGISWGRWASGTAFDSSTQSEVSLQQAPLHAVLSAAADSDAFATPLTGRIDYALIGATQPTDNHGNLGQLGQASLVADFDAGQVQTTVDLEIADLQWSASGSGALGADNGFAGGYDEVLAGSLAGSGRFAGFIQNAADVDGVVGGGGFVYLLQAGDSRVGGAAVFRELGAQSDGSSP